MDPNYKQNIVSLNHCLFNQLAATAYVDRRDSIMFVNPKNPAHQQSNVCCRLHLPDATNDTFDGFLAATRQRFSTLSLQPRYHVTEHDAAPSLDTLASQFLRHGFQVDRDIDMIMACTHASFIAAFSQNDSGSKPLSAEHQVRRARMGDLAALTHLFGEAFGYGDDLDWLQYKLASQLRDYQVAIYVLAQEACPKIISAVILNSPDGHPDLMHVNVCATHPEYQRLGLGLECLQVALAAELKPNKTAYLEVYDEIAHAQRMYRRAGFQDQGSLHHLTAYLPRV
ncbi:hypothetical protein DM01DRAFT_1331970 [Hesseltinella vesiculosa]|uniref:N-acetyltransferase domain-containing protein n=1 Tax=Hesseltinella vesiculosa TaxID=101127 RepID=A0A1X2GTN7_9FUNG|nr:hypothetical protein DM01DRAFT_1331970 [Hesseltinella vesiculosa]